LIPIISIYKISSAPTEAADYAESNRAVKPGLLEIINSSNPSIQRYKSEHTVAIILSIRMDDAPRLTNTSFRVVLLKLCVEMSTHLCHSVITHQATPIAIAAGPRRKSLKA
jgi:hypothetical protein